MGTNGTGRNLATRLFDLFRGRESYEIVGLDGEPTGDKVWLQALDWQQNQALLKDLESARFRVRSEMAGSGARESLVEQVSGLNLEMCIDMLLNLERPTATNVADLAPGGSEEETKKAKEKEEAATKKWEEARKAELAEMELAEVREIVVRRQETLFVQARAIQDYINQTLCLMVIDPETGEPAFSADEFLEDGHTPSPNYIGHLMPELRDQLLKFREQFLAKRSDKAVRKTAEDKSFLPSGESPSPDTGTPGETTETPRRSRRSPSPSTTVADG